MTTHTATLPATSPTRASTTTDTHNGRRRLMHDRGVLAITTLMTIALIAETLLRINGIIPDLVGQIVFGSAVALGIGGTGLLALTAPAGPAATPTDRDAGQDRPVRAPTTRRRVPLPA